jgi:hypothetical protein
MSLPPLFQSILRAHGAPPSSRAATVKAHPDLSCGVPRHSAWCAYDENTYDGALDVGRQIVGWGATAEASLADYDAKLLEQSL